jgi:diguanylate cyclase (GGDEF)-like protein
MLSSAKSPYRALLIAAAVTVSIACAVGLYWPGAYKDVASQSYLPHGYCYLWNPQLLTLHVVSDSIIFLSYLSIGFTLAWLVHRQRRYIPFSWMFIAFGLFIIACGFTHAMDILVLWHPLYWLAADVKLVTAVASLSTAIALPFVVPRVGLILRAARSSRRNERRFLAASDSSSHSFIILKSIRNADLQVTDFRFQFVNSVGASLLSSSPDSLRGKHLCKLFPSNRADGFFDVYKSVVDTGERVEREFKLNSRDPEPQWLHLEVVKLDDGVAVTATEITELKKQQSALAGVARFTQSIIDSSPFATIATDAEGLITSINPAAERMLWFTRQDLVNNETPMVFLDPRAVLQRASELADELQTSIDPGIDVLLARPRLGLVEESEWRLIRRDGSHFDAQLTVSGLTTLETNQDALSDDPISSLKTVGFLFIAYDITERKRMADYISHLAHHDALTGLPTRSLLSDRLSVAISRAARIRNKVALLLVDLDHFKRVNDLMGHHVGDNLLTYVAATLKQCVRASNTVARMGGDEFVILLDDISSIEDAEFVAAKVLNALRKPVELNDQVLTVHASIGICLYPENGDNGETLLRHADAAMYRSKADGRNSFQTFTHDMANAFSRRRELETALLNALARDEFRLVYQPQVQMNTGEVTGFEALLRWHNPSLGIVMPNDFIPLAEENGFIIPLGEWVLRTACRQGRELQQRFGRQFTIAVNISPRQFQNEALTRTIRDILRECSLDPASLELEITENVLLNDSQVVTRVLEEIRSLGVRIAIDDFGTGFSSMSYVLRFRVDRLKIDKSFVRNLSSDAHGGAVTSAIIALAKGLQIPVIAEGVETAAHRDFLLDQNCLQAQGYLYSEPISLDSIADIINSIELNRVS